MTSKINTAVIVAINGSTIPRIEKSRILEKFEAEEGELLAAQVSDLVREAVAMPVEWSGMTLREGVNHVLGRFHEKHPELSREALYEIGRCVGWNVRQKYCDAKFFNNPGSPGDHSMNFLENDASGPGLAQPRIDVNAKF